MAGALAAIDTGQYGPVPTIQAAQPATAQRVHDAARRHHGDEIQAVLDRSRAGREAARYDRYRGERAADVVIVGGGLTGCATAYALAAAGAKVMLLEAERIGAGATGACSGLVRQEPSTDFRTLADTHGLKAARAMWQAFRRAALDLAATVRRLGIRCDLDETACVEIVEGQDAERAFKREVQARRDAGLDAAWLNARAARSATGTDALAGIRTTDHAVIDPFRACLGLAKAAAERGAVLHERSPVQRIKARRRAVEIRTAGGTIEARWSSSQPAIPPRISARCVAM